MIWHNVVSVSGLRVRYNPQSRVFQLRCAKHVPMKLTVLSDFSLITVWLSDLKEHNLTFIPPQTPPNQNLDGSKKKLDIGVRKTPKVP